MPKATPNAQPAPQPTHGGVYELVNGRLVAKEGGPPAAAPAPTPAPAPAPAQPQGEGA